MKPQAVQSPFLQSCDIGPSPFRMESFVMVIFGGAGDLSRRKLLPTLLHLFLEGELPQEFYIVGVGRPGLSHQAYRAMMKEAVKEHMGEGPLDAQSWAAFAKRLFYSPGDLQDMGTYRRLTLRLRRLLRRCAEHVIYYLAVPPDALPHVLKGLEHSRACPRGERSKVIVEKPFGTDRASAVRLNRLIHKVFSEAQVYRIDHYLSKEPVQNIMFLRFSNTIFERLWNSRYIEHVQITAAEDTGVGDRGAFYEQTGVVRDMLQSHLLQLLALVAMEPPIGFEPDFIRDEKVKIFRSIRPLDEAYIREFAVRGQYGPGEVGGQRTRGYRQEKGVRGDSTTPTFCALKLQVANWRWAGVPFYLRTGKRLKRKLTEIALVFKQPPLRLFGRACDVLEPNCLLLTIQPRERICLSFGVKYPYGSNQIYPVKMVFGYQEAFNLRPHPPYERLLVDCMKGDLTLFVRQDGVEAMWAVVDPLIQYWEAHPPKGFPNYRAGTWGPRGAERLLARGGRKWLLG